MGGAAAPHTPRVGAWGAAAPHTVDYDWLRPSSSPEKLVSIRFDIGIDTIDIPAKCGLKPSLRIYVQIYVLLKHVHAARVAQNRRFPAAWPCTCIYFACAACGLQPASADRSTMGMGSKAALMALLVQMYGCGREPDRDITFVEIFAGEAAVSRGMRLVGFAGETFDLRKSASHDILTPVGFLAILAAAMRIRRGGVLWAAPPCSTWVFLSRHSTGRGRDPSGNWQTSDYIASQNALVCRLLLLARLCIARGVYYIIEQPRSSCMFKYGPFAEFLKKHPATSVCTEMGAFGMMAEKDMNLIGTAPYLPMLERRLTTEQRKELRSNSKRKQTSVVTVRADGTKNVQGGRDLKSTQAYPIGFGCAHALAFKAYDDSAAAVDEDAPPAKRRHVASPPAAADMGPNEAAILVGILPAAAVVGSRSLANPDPSSDEDDDSTTPEDDDSRRPAAADIGTNAFLPAREREVGAPMVDGLADMSDDEDPWYLDDLRTWNPKRWHDNSAEENKLKLT